MIVHDISPAAHYDRVTDAWTLLLGQDLHYGVFATAEESLPEATDRLTALMAEATDLHTGSRFLDVGCGVGTSTQWVVRRYGVTAVGISTSEHGVERARQRAGADDSLSFEVRDGMRNGFAGESFDRVWALESSHLMRDRAGLIGECARVLRQGGRFTLCDIVLARPVDFASVRALRSEFALLNRVFGDARMETLDTYGELAAAAGLEVDLRRDLSAQVRPTFARWRANGIAHRDAVSASIGVVGWREFMDSCDILERMWDRGILGYGMFSARKM
ncbi:SAM-dependent methyltransferase [Nocardia sp. NPDC055002]